jgi:hypothetical protein
MQAVKFPGSATLRGQHARNLKQLVGEAAKLLKPL